MLHAMSTDERVLIRLHDGGEHAGQITQRPRDGLVLDTGDEISVACARRHRAGQRGRSAGRDRCGDQQRALPRLVVADLQRLGGHIGSCPLRIKGGHYVLVENVKKGLTADGP
jgi:hypothetical protein